MDRSDWLAAILISVLMYLGILYWGEPELPPNKNVSIVEKGGFQWKKSIQDRLPEEPL